MNATCEKELIAPHSFLTKIAKAIRVLTIPPLMVAALLSVLFFCDDVFPTVGDYLLSMLFLAIVPVMAYPLQRVVPAWRRGGRRTERKLAFVISIFSYGAAVACSVARDAVPNLLFISVVYFASVLILTLFNTLTPWRASGHACSIAGPILLICLFVGWYAIPIGAVLYVASFWASVYMKRHTVREFLLGTLSAALAAVICYFIVHPIF